MDEAVAAPSSGQCSMSSGKQLRQVGHSFIRWFYYPGGSRPSHLFVNDFSGCGGDEQAPSQSGAVARPSGRALTLRRNALPDGRATAPFTTHTIQDTSSCVSSTTSFTKSLACSG